MIKALRLLAFTALVVIAFSNGTSAFRVTSLGDFGAFVAAGRAARSGASPYTSDLALIESFELPWTGTFGMSSNVNPPVSVLLFDALLSDADPWRALCGWRLLSLLCYLATVGMLSRAYPTPLTPLCIAWLLGLGAFWHIIERGQIYAPLALLVASAWLCLRNRHDVAAGLLIGIVVAFKPHFAVWPVLLFFAGYRRPALAAASTALMLMALPVLRYGPGIYGQWMAAAAAYGGVTAPANGSMIAFAARLGSPLAGAVASAATGVVLLLYVWRRRPDPLPTSALALCASLLIAPIAWSMYTVFLLPVLISRRWSWLEYLAAAGMSISPGLIWELARASFTSFALTGSHSGYIAILLLAITLRDLHVAGAHEPPVSAIQ